jgi:hypothetical protein
VLRSSANQSANLCAQLRSASAQLQLVRSCEFIYTPTLLYDSSLLNINKYQTFKSQVIANSHKPMPVHDQHEETPGVDQGSPTQSLRPAPPALPTLTLPLEEEPYSIFDKRQKALIVVIVSTAATCKYFATVIIILPTSLRGNSLWICIEHIFSSTTYHCT